MRAKNHRPAFTIVELIVCIAIVGILFALLLPATRSTRGAARRSQCKNNLKQIALALHNYQDEYGSLPPAVTYDADGRPLHSWRTLILPYIDQPRLYEQIDLSKPWDDPANVEVSKTFPNVYECPSADSDVGFTTFLAVTTPDSAFPPDDVRPLEDIADGTSQTLMVVEVPPADAVPWMQPVDVDLDGLITLRDAKETSHQGGFQAAFADGTVRYIPNSIPAETLTALSTASGGDDAGEY